MGVIQKVHQKVGRGLTEKVIKMTGNFYVPLILP